MQQIHLSSLAPSRILDFPFKNKGHLEKLPQVLKNHLSMSPFHNCTIVQPLQSCTVGIRYLNVIYRGW